VLLSFSLSLSLSLCVYALGCGSPSQGARTKEIAQKSGKIIEIKSFGENVHWKYVLITTQFYVLTDVPKVQKNELLQLSNDITKNDS
jgi:hypothetical protein